jgi:hypothetical protein
MLQPLILAVAVAGWCQQAPWPEAAFTPEEIEAARKDPGAFDLSDNGLRIEWRGLVIRPREVTPPPVQGGEDPVVVLDQIINIGRKIWKIVDENKPVVDIRTQYAAAVPEGITHWSQLSGWDTPAGTIYGFTARNAYGSTMVDVRYQVLRTTGGGYKGKGHYLTGVTVEPLTVAVGWGYRFSMTAEVPSVTNADKTGRNPTAGMMLTVKWRIQTPIKDHQGTGVYYVRGDGLFVEVGGPFAKKEVREAAARVERVQAGFAPIAAMIGGRAW